MRFVPSRTASEVRVSFGSRVTPAQRVSVRQARDGNEAAIAQANCAAVDPGFRICSGALRTVLCRGHAADGDYFLLPPPNRTRQGAPFAVGAAQVVRTKACWFWARGGVQASLRNLHLRQLDCAVDCRPGIPKRD